MTVRVFHSEFYPDNSGVKGTSVVAASQRSLVDVVKALDEATMARVIAARARAKELIDEAEDRLSQAAGNYDQAVSDLNTRIDDAEEEYGRLIGESEDRLLELIDLVDPASGTPGRRILNLEVDQGNMLIRLGSLEGVVGTDDGKGSLFGRVAELEAIEIGEGYVRAEDFEIVEARVQRAPRLFVQPAPGPSGSPDGIALQSGDLWLNPDNNNQLFRYETDQWVSATPLGSSLKVFYQPEEPASGMSVGDLWIDSDSSNQMYRFDGADWLFVSDPRVNTLSATVLDHSVAISNLETGKAEASVVSRLAVDSSKKNRIYVLPTEPVSPVDEVAIAYGDMWIDSANGNQVYIWKGSTDGWVLSGDTRALDEILAARGDSLTLKGRIDSVEQTVTDQLEGLVTTSVFDSLSAEVRTAAGVGKSLSQRLQELEVDADGLATSEDISRIQTEVSKRSRTYAQNSAPTGTLADPLNEGDLWIDTTGGANILKRYNGDAWVNTNPATGTKTFAQNTTPTGAQVGDIWFHTGQNNRQYRFGTEGWEDIQSPGSTTYAQPEGPTTANTKLTVGDLWVDTDDNNKMYRWSGLTWVVVTGNSIKTYVQAEAPTPAFVGDLWFDTTQNSRLKRYNGSDWVFVEDERIEGMLNTIASHSSTLASWETGKANASVVETLSTTTNLKNRTFIQSDPPTSPMDDRSLVYGDIWVDTTSTNNVLKVWRGTSLGWVEASDQRAIKELESARGGEVSLAARLGSIVSTFNDALDGKAGATKYDYLETEVRLAAGGTGKVLSQRLTQIESDMDGKVEFSDISGMSAQLALTAKTFVGNTAPPASTNGVNLATGDIWIDTTNGLNKIKKYTAGSGWSDITPASSSIKTFVAATAPTAGMSAGDIWFNTSLANRQYRYSGTVWESVQSPGSTSYVSATQPAGSTYLVGDLWINTSKNNEISRYDGSNWVSVHSKSITTYAQPGTPAAPYLGDLWIDTDDNNIIKRYNGTSWAEVTDNRIGSLVLDVERISTAVGSVESGTGLVSSVDTIGSTLARKNRTFTAASEPANPSDGVSLVVGDTWIKTSEGNAIYVWRNQASVLGWHKTNDERALSEIAAARDGKATLAARLTDVVNAATNAASGKADASRVETLEGRVDTVEGNVEGAIEDIGLINTELGIGASTTRLQTVEASVNAKSRVILHTSAPSNPHLGVALVRGDVWVNTLSGSTNWGEQKHWGGTAWEDTTDKRIKDANTNAASAVAKLTGITTTVVDALTGKANASTVSILEARSNKKTTTYRQNGQPTASSVVVNGTTVTIPLVVGDQWFNTTEGMNMELKVWSGSAWLATTDPRIAAALTAADGAVSRITDLEDTYADDLLGKADATRVRTLEVALDGDPDAPVNSSARKGMKARLNTTESVAVDANGMAKAIYGIESDVNGYVTGFKSENNGSSSNFAIRADKFQVRPSTSTGARTEYSGNSWKVYGPNGVLRVEMGVF